VAGRFYHRPMKNSNPTGVAALAAGLCVALTALAPVPARGEAGTQPAGAAGRREAIAATTGASDSAWRQAAARFGGVETFTKPSRDVTMRFSFPTEIREVAVVGGQRVKAGELLIRARDAEIKAALDVQKLRAGTDLEVKAAEAQLELAKFRYKNLLEAREKGSGSAMELEERRIEQRQAELTLDQAKVRLQEAQLLVQQAEGRYETYRLEAPFDGVVEEVMVDVGQGVNEQMPAIRVVNTEILWLDAFPRTGETVELGLKEGSPAWVLLDLHGGGRLVQGKVLYVSPVADSVSLTRRVRVEIANPTGLPAGTQAMVRFTPPEGEWPRLDEAEPAGVASRAGSETSR